MIVERTSYLMNLLKIEPRTGTHPEALTVEVDLDGMSKNSSLISSNIELGAKVNESVDTYCQETLEDEMIDLVIRFHQM